MKLKNLVQKKLAAWFNKKEIVLKFPQAVVSFTFDDFPISAVENGARILKNSDFKGTFYASMGMMGKQNTSVGDLFKLEHLEYLVANNHEIACHTYNHLHAFDTNSSDFFREFSRNSEALKKYFPTLNFSNFSYPFGEITLGVKRLAVQNFSTARSTDFGLNKGAVDLFNLKAVKLYENHFSIAQLKEIILEGVASKAWIILYTHDVTEDFSDYGCSPNYFEEVVQFCKKNQILNKTVDGAVLMLDMQ